MLDDSAVKSLLAGRHLDPFAVLGLHADDSGRLWLRSFLPGAESVQVVDAATGNKICALAQRDPAGLFESAIPRRRKRFDYRLLIRWHSGAETELVDAYAFGPQLQTDDLVLLREGNHPAPYTVLGAQPMQVDGIEGVRFALWAPNARRVSVIGTFNQWDGRRHPMRASYRCGCPRA